MQLHTALKCHIARLLNRSSRTCWAELCVWSGFDDAPFPRGDSAAECRRVGETGACYCGKFVCPEWRAAKQTEGQP